MIQIMLSDRKGIKLIARGVILSGCAIMIFWQATTIEAAGPKGADAQLDQEISAPSKKSPVHLYFSDRHNYYLTAEQRVVNHSENPTGLAETIVEELIKGPQKGLQKTIPAGTQLRAIYITPDGTCYVDLSETVRKNHPGGSKSELFTIYSMVNSLVLNVQEIERVKILIDGKEAITLAGHIDLQLPVKANMLLIR